MESVPFEKFGISECKFDGCDQKFNANSVALAVWLYGVILLKQLKSPILTEEREREAKEHILGITLTEQETLKMREETKGFIGITCPKCRKTSLYETNYNGLTDFEMMLQSSLKNRSHFQEKPYEFSTTKPIPIALKYYSPVQMPSDLRERFSEESFYYSEYAYSGVMPFGDELGVSLVDDTLNPPENSFASYSEWSVPEPAGSSVCLEWFDEKKLSEIIEHENEKSVRIMPRYHYYQDLMDKCDNLLRYKLYTGSNFDQELKNIEGILDGNVLDEQTKIPYKFKHSDLKRSRRHQQYLDFDPKKFGEFLNILTSEPIEFNPFIKENKGINDYLWGDKDPFKGQGLPVDFAFEDQDDKNDVKSDELKKSHNKIVNLVQDNFHKQYVQEFLRENLVDFLEEYEELIQRNKFSYAHVWKLKESYLEGLHKATLKGISSESHYVMMREGKSWKIKFGGTISSPLYGRGFAYIYHLLSKENDYTDHYELYLAAGGGLSDPRGKGKAGTTELKGSKVEHDDAPESIYKKPEPMITQKELNDCFNSKEKLEQEIDEAKTLGKEHKEAQLQQELDGLMKFMPQVYDFKKKKIRFEKNETTIKVTNAVGKAIERALESLKKHDKKAAEYIAEAIDHKHLYQNSISYRPDPKKRVDWILA